jgi:hypothetical protein
MDGSSTAKRHKRDSLTWETRMIRMITPEARNGLRFLTVLH